MTAPNIEILLEAYRRERDGMFPKQVIKHLDDRMQIAFDRMANSELYKTLLSEHFRLSETMSGILTPAGIVIFRELTEVEEHMQYYNLDAAYLEGFKEGMSFISRKFPGMA